MLRYKESLADEADDYTRSQYGVLLKRRKPKYVNIEKLIMQRKQEMRTLHDANNHPGLEYLLDYCSAQAWSSTQPFDDTQPDPRFVLQNVQPQQQPIIRPQPQQQNIRPAANQQVVRPIIPFNDQPLFNPNLHQHMQHVMNQQFQQQFHQQQFNNSLPVYFNHHHQMLPPPHQNYQPQFYPQYFNHPPF